MGNTVSATLAEPAVHAGVVARGAAAWTPSSEILRFCLGGREIGSLRLNAMLLTTPFSHLSTNVEESAPTRDMFVAGVDAFVVPAQPVAAQLPRVKFLPGMIRYVGPETNHFSVNLQGAFTEYLKRFSSKSRWKLTST